MQYWCGDQIALGNYQSSRVCAMTIPPVRIATLWCLPLLLLRSCHDTHRLSHSGRLFGEWSVLDALEVTRM